MDDTQQHILAIVRETLEKLGVKLDGVSLDMDNKTGSIRYVVVTPDSALLIGERGTRLLALNHVIKKITEKRFPDTSFMIDVNDYQKKRIDDLRAKAHMLAERARYFKSSVEMDPMSSYERMIIHAEFTESPDIHTESSGKGKDRHVVLRYSESKSPLAEHIKV